MNTMESLNNLSKQLHLIRERDWDQGLVQHGPCPTETTTSETPSELFHLIRERAWGLVLARLAFHPNESKLMHHHLRLGNDVALHLACGNGAPAHVVETLLEIFPKAITMKGCLDSTPLHKVCNGNFSIFRNYQDEDERARVAALLLRAFPDAALLRDKDGNTPLHRACFYGISEKTTRLLLEAKPEAVFIRKKERRGGSVTPLEFLCRRWRTAFQGIFVKSQTSGRKLDKFLSERERTLWNTAQLLVKAEYYGTTNESLPNHKKSLVCACAGLNNRYPPEILGIAINTHADELREADQDGNLPLHIAASCALFDPLPENERLEVLTNAYPQGAQVRNREGKIPFQLVVESNMWWTNGVGVLFDASVQALASMPVTNDFCTALLAYLATEAHPTALFKLLTEVPDLMKIE